AVGRWSRRIFRRELATAGYLRGLAVAALVCLGGGALAAERITTGSEERLYADEIILARTSAYQRIVLTRWTDDLRLFLNGHLQFSSRDEYRYHETLVHPAVAAHAAPRRVLVLGGGDGLAVREIVKYPAVQSVTLVDLDAEMTRLFSHNPVLIAVNGGALRDPLVRVGLAPPARRRAFPHGLRFLATQATPALFVFPPDMAAVPVEVNRLDNQILVQYYGAEWQRIFPSL